MTKIIKPTQTIYNLVWEPSPYIADSSMQPHAEPESPDAHIFLVVEISMTQFERHAAFEANNEYKWLKNSGLWYCGNAIVYLVCDQRDVTADDDHIYAIMGWKGRIFLFGRMVEDNQITKICREEFSKLMGKIG